MGLGNPFHEDGAESKEGRCVLGLRLGLGLEGRPQLTGLGSPQSERTERTMAGLRLGVSAPELLLALWPRCGACGPSRVDWALVRGLGRQADGQIVGCGSYTHPQA